MGRYGTGQAVRRVEDLRFLTGQGRYTDDIVLERQAYLCLVRSPYAHGRIVTVDTAEAAASPGVLAVVTADDIRNAGFEDIVGMGLPASRRNDALAPLRQPPLARDRVRYVGEPVVAIVAETISDARDAAELVMLEIDDETAVVNPVDALAAAAPTIHPGVPGNLYGTYEYGSAEDTAARFAAAQHVVDIEVINNRLAPTAMEPRGCNALFADGHLTLFQGCQGAHVLRDRLAQTTGLDAGRITVIAPDVGGGFGLKYFLQCEPVVAVCAAMLTGRPVKWRADRTESFLADTHGRDHVSRASLALDGDGRILAMRAAIVANIGAYCSQAGPYIPFFGASMSSGCYDVDCLHVEVRNAVTNTVPVEAYRGAGRPEAAYLIERLMDKAARQLGMAPDEIRRRNLIRPERFPYLTQTGSRYDSGEYEALLDAALERADWQGFGDRKRDSANRGRLRGIGISCYVETCSGLGHESVDVRVSEDGRIQALVGTQATGQGHETTYAQMVADTLGVDMDIVDVVQGDTDKVPSGFGTVGSRSMAIGGSSLVLSLDELIESGRRMAAELLEAADTDIEFDAARYTIAGTDRSVSLFDAAALSYDPGRRPADVSAGLAANVMFRPEAGTFPNGCHVCELEVDPDTGVVEILKYTIEDDVGVVINPQILEGQIVGGVAQGLGQAAGEHAIYDRDSGQLLTATFMDYPMPRADWIPDVDFRYREVPSPRNPLGVKGAGEAGTVGAAPAYINALLDALAAAGVGAIDMPATPLSIWSALRHESAT